MKPRVLVLALVVGALVVAPAGVHAQLGGLLKKKAGDLLKGKPTETKPADPAPAPTTTEPSPSPSTGGGATPAPAPARAAAPTPAKSTDPLDPDNMNLTSNINRFVRDERPVPEGEWNEVPYFGKATSDALKALDDAGRVAFVEKMGGVIKTLVLSSTFADAHAKAIKDQFDAVDHGLTGVLTLEQLMAKKDFAGMEAYNKRQYSANIVEGAERQSEADIKRTLTYNLESWKQAAQQSTGKSKAKYERLLKEGNAAMAATDVATMRRGYALTRSIDMDGPDTVDALYAQGEQGKKEKEQAAWNEHNLKAVLKQQLAAFVKVASTVDFAAQTVDKNGRKLFANATYERKGSMWKACFRAGKPAVTAAQQFAQAWLKEL